MVILELSQITKREASKFVDFSHTRFSFPNRETRNAKRKKPPHTL